MNKKKETNKRIEELKKTIDKAAAEKSEKLATCEASLNDAKTRLSAASAELEIVEDATEYAATLETIRRTKAEVEFYSKQLEKLKTVTPGVEFDEIKTEVLTEYNKFMSGSVAEIEALFFELWTRCEEAETQARDYLQVIERAAKLTNKRPYNDASIYAAKNKFDRDFMTLPERSKHWGLFPEFIRSFYLMNSAKIEKGVKIIGRNYNLMP